jgi:hypothetical protein
MPAVVWAGLADMGQPASTQEEEKLLVAAILKLLETVWEISRPGVRGQTIEYS